MTACGDVAAAIGDLLAANDLAPSNEYACTLAQLLAKNGQTDIATGLLMAPQMERMYELNGIVPPAQ